jgi:Glyoxalase/Bleomycin resistance protein/Dioxygenase superfamily
MTVRPLAPHYHVGIVVPDLVEAQAELTRQLGVTWGPVLHFDATDVRDEAGRDVLLPITLCYSVEAPHLELIEEVPGTVWTCNDHSNLHHIGFWSDDLPGSSAALSESGCPLQLCGRAGAVAPSSWAYHRTGLGIRIEVVDAAMRDAMAVLFQPPT